MSTPTPWPSGPFKLIASTGIDSRPDIPKDHYCRKNAQIMALTHNTIFRGLNSIYHHAPLVQPSTQDASDLLQFCGIVYDFIHGHHTIEEQVYFPGIEEASGIPGLMVENFEQHKRLDEGLQAFQEYAEKTTASSYDPETLRRLIDDMVEPLGNHMHDEVPTILDLHDKLESETLKSIYGKMHKAAEKQDMFKSGPFAIGNQDKTFLLDGVHVPFPELPSVVNYAVDYIISRRYRGAWRFNSSDMYGNMKSFPLGIN
ncbi:hypothetical protein FQN55_008519 [Onygenales sp. PD_40]|nr:hypothetical protein FQN55_008519 [Onygenales sp. PD_40]